MRDHCTSAGCERPRAPRLRGPQSAFCVRHQRERRATRVRKYQRDWVRDHRAAANARAMITANHRANLERHGPYCDLCGECYQCYASEPCFSSTDRKHQWPKKEKP